MYTDADLIVCAGEVVTCAEPFSIARGALAVSGGRVLEVGEASSLAQKYSCEVAQFPGKTLVPGFVDSHTHLVWEGTREKEFVMKLAGRSYLEIQKAGGGIYYTVERTRKASRETLARNATSTLDRMLSCGTTTVEAKSGYGLDVPTELKSLEVLSRLTHPVDVCPTYLAHLVPREYSGREGEYIALVKGLLSEIEKRGLARYADVFCDEGAFTKEQAREILLEARRRGFALKMHADEFSSGGAELASELSCVSADHLLQVTESGMESLARGGTVGCLLPGTPFTLGTGYAPARRMLEKGVTVALATDFNPNCMCESMQVVMSLACMGMKMTPREALTASTVGGARALGLDDVGSLVKGKKADFSILDAPSHEHLGYRFGANLVTHVFKEGKMVVEDGRVRK